MRSLVVCALVLAPFTFSPAHAASVVPNVGQSADGIIAARSGRYARKNCTPVNGPYGFYGNIFCRPTEQEYLRNLGANWPQQDPRYYQPYKGYKARR